MDFVDLDKVLDEFEEEEKAANSITPGQEVKPSGFSAFVESRQDRPWESVSEVPISSLGMPFGHVLPGKNTLDGGLYDYDVPYDSGGNDRYMPNRKKTSSVSNVEYGKGDLDLGLGVVEPCTKNDYFQYQSYSILDKMSSQTNDLHVEEKPALVMTSSGEAVKDYLNNSGHNVSYGDLNESSYSKQNGVIVHEDFQNSVKGLKASQVTAVQTDALTPGTEKELTSVPYPKSDIIVDGHDNSQADAVQQQIIQSSSSEGKMLDSTNCSDDTLTSYANSESISSSMNQQNAQHSTAQIGLGQALGQTRSFELNSNSEASLNFGSTPFNGMDIGQVDPHTNSVTTVGFGNVDYDVDDDEVNNYLKDYADTPEPSQNQQTVHSRGMPEDQQMETMKNPDIVLDISRNEGLKPNQNGNVQYSHPPVSRQSDNFGTNGTSVPPETAGFSNWKVEETVTVNSITPLSANLDSQRNDSKCLGVSEFDPETSDNTMKLQVCDARKNNESAGPPSDVLHQALHVHKTDESMNKSVDDCTMSSGQDLQVAVGVGARPKDPSAIKKNRPNSLLGLSKINMDSPYNIVHEVTEKTESTNDETSCPPEIEDICQNQTQAGVEESMIGQVAKQQITANDSVTTGVSNLNAVNIKEHATQFETGEPFYPPNVSQPFVGAPTEKLPSPECKQKQLTNFEIRQQIEQEQRQRMDRMTGQTEVHIPELQQSITSEPVGGQVMPDTSSESSGEVSAIAPGKDELMDDDDEAPVMRRTEEHQDSDDKSGAMTRPHSWSPGSGQAAVQGKMKRPTSLNLPPRGEFALVGERSPDTGGRMRTVGRIHPDDIPEEGEQSVGDECSEGDEGLMEASGMADESNVPLPGDVPQSIIHSQLGRVAPTWLPDQEAPNCMQCASRFTFTKRRHHCRACGKVFCSSCCSLKCSLAYMDMKEARVCQQCHQLLQSGSQRRTEPKQVMFSDGIRPGGDLTELDGSSESRLPPRRIGRMQKKVEKSGGSQTSPKTRKLKGTENARNRSLIPENGLPPLYIVTDTEEISLDEQFDSEKHLQQIKDEDAQPVTFAINSNVQVQVKILMLDCCVNRECWCFSTRGMCTIGQDEIVIILECFPEETIPPRDIFCHFETLYEEASKGNTVTNMSHTIFNHSFLDSRDHGGFLYLRPTFQCLQKLILPQPPYLLGILLQKWETPWAKVFPLRLLLRLGAEYRYYPCPLVSIRNRKPVFFEIGHTIMNLLADFRNYQYMLPQIRGVHIHMEDKKTTISFPRNRYDELMKVVNTSNEHVMALGSSFSPDADSHLVCIQNDDGNYQTQAINIQNKPRKVTGASFVVFNGALKTSSGLRAKSSIVEDGLMVQILPECMVAVKQAIKDMTDFTITCGPVSVEKVEEVVTLQWVEDDKNVNNGVKSPIDRMALDGIESIHIQNSTDYVGENRAIRWTEVFFIQNEDSGARWEPVDLSRLAETLASATCISLTQHLDRLKEAHMSKIGLRVTIDTEQVGYEIGSNGEKLADFYMNDLDSGLIPVIHGAASQNQDGPIVLELIFYILE